MSYRYTTAATVRRYDSMLSASVDGTNEFTDAVIEGVIDSHAMPHVDSKLGPAGYTVPFTAADDSGLLSVITAMIAAAELISGDVAQFAGGTLPEKSARLMEVADELLDGIVSGDKYISYPRNIRSLDTHFDREPLTRPANEIIVGASGNKWHFPDELREVDDKRVYLAVGSDPHIQDSLGLANFNTCVSWVNSEYAGGKNIVGFVVTGDLMESSHFSVSFREYAYNTTKYTDTDDIAAAPIVAPGLNSKIPLIPAVGNWDSDIVPGVYDTVTDPTHATMLARYPEHYRDGNMYFNWDHKNLIRVMSISDLTDYTADNGSNAYYNCNPPGTVSGPPANSDFSGMTVAVSAQNTWLATAMQSSHPWKIVACHRPFWATYDSGIRKLNRAARPFLADAITSGISLFLTGDVHCGSLTGPWAATGDAYETLKDPGQWGAYELTLAGGFANRNISTDHLPDPDRSVLWSSGKDGSSSNKAQVALLGFEENKNTVSVTIFQAWRDDTAGSVVFSTNIVQNRGAA